MQYRHTTHTIHTRHTRLLLPAAILSAGLLAAAGLMNVGAQSSGPDSPADLDTLVNASRLMREGRRTFRFDTFGDEAFWGGALKLHDAIQGEKLGGVGPGVSPRTALAVGLKVDVNALPSKLTRAIRQGAVNLDDPGTTLALLKLDAVVGVRGFFRPNGSLQSVGITCALCHSTVDNTLAPGIGRRLDGWANRDLNVGAIVGLSPDLSAVNNLLGVPDATTRAVLAS